ncbi:MAG TPA: alpha/beta hydrolase [Opitutaceae bacterium]|nr:alpha/beta hydrolase [Opitutaceae bacterium]
MTKTILFIHGMFQNSVSWRGWVSFFERHGFSCSAPSWPRHQGVPRELRLQVPAGLGHLTLAEVVDEYERDCRGHGDKPILIGHSVGGLVAQILAARGLASAAVCISSVAPNDLIAADWHLMKNIADITNPLRGHSIYEMTPEAFHENFCNTLSAAESLAAYGATATHDSRQVLRDCLGPQGWLNLAAPHVPLLFVGGGDDHIIPAALNRRNCEHYRDPGSVAEFIEFPGRGHFICGAPGWEEVAERALGWIESHVAVGAGAGGEQGWKPA